MLARGPCRWTETAGSATDALCTISPIRAMSAPPEKPTMRGAVAGSMLVAAIVLCAAVGYGIGTLVGAPVALGLLGLFAGPVAGIALVRSRFKDL